MALHHYRDFSDNVAKVFTDWPFRKSKYLKAIYSRLILEDILRDLDKVFRMAKNNDL
jgi:hypothetical protein